MNLNVHITDNRHELNTYQAQWHDLAERQPDSLALLSQWSYLQALLAHHPIAQLAVLLVTRQDTTGPHALVGALPLHLLNVRLPDAERPLRIAVTLGARYAPYLDYLIDPAYRQDVWKAVLRVLRDHLRLDGFLAGPLHQTSPNYAQLSELLTPDAYCRLSHNNNYQINTQWLDLDRYAARRSIRTLKDAAYRERRLQRLGRLTLERVTQPDAVGAGLDFIDRYMQTQFGEKVLYRDFAAWKAGFRDLAAQNDPLLQLNTLCLDGRTIAAMLLLNHRERQLFLLTGYDLTLKAHAPGKVLLHRLIRQAFAERKRFCFGGGYYAYKRLWATECYSLNLLALFFTDAARRDWAPQVTWTGIVPLLNAA